MKRVFTFTVFVLLALGLFAGGRGQTVQSDGPPRIVVYENHAVIGSGLCIKGNRSSA